MATRLADDTLSASWLAARFAIEPFRLEAMRRDGEVIAFRPAGAREHHYPLWQFDEEGNPLPVVPRVVREAHARGLRGNRLYEILSARAGLGGDEGTGAGSEWYDGRGAGDRRRARSAGCGGRRGGRGGTGRPGRGRLRLPRDRSTAGTSRSEDYDNEHDRAGEGKIRESHFDRGSGRCYTRPRPHGS